MANEWVEIDEGFKRRSYTSYDSYIGKQGAKLERYGDAIAGWSKRNAEQLRELLPSLGVLQPGMSALCLGARLGFEVEAFIDLGCFAVGIDVNPGSVEKFGFSKYVVYGDFHQLQFANNSIDIVYTNSMDHVFAPQKLRSEVTRVLKPGGYLIVETTEGTEEGRRRVTDPYDCLTWKTSADFISFFETSLALVRQFKGPNKNRRCGFVFEKEMRNE